MEQTELPLLIRGKWIRFREKLPFAGRRLVKSVAPCSVILGVKGAGKSSLAENIATHYVDPVASPDKTGKILDLYASRDNESLAFCRSPYSDSILFIVGDSVDVSSSWDYKHIKDVKLRDFRNYKIILTCSAFFSRRLEEHHSLARIMDLLEKRTHWTNPWCLIIREAANLIYSRISIGEDQARAKAYFVYLLRQARHLGYAVTCDAIRFRAVDIDLRAIADYTFIKATGIYGLPAELRFLYRWIEPYSLMRCPVHRCLLATRKGSIGIGEFEYPPFHKEERDDMLKALDIQVDKGEPIDYGDKGYHRVSDFEHEKMVKMRREGEEGIPLSMDKIAESLKRSSATVWKEINAHNKAIRELGKCPRCERVRCELQKVEV